MAGKEPVNGPTALTVAENISRLRTSQNLSFTQLSDRLASVQWSISPVAIRRIEQCERRVNVDDLVALAAALDVSPISLLVPHNTEDPADPIKTTGVLDATEAGRVWKWLRADDALVPSENGIEWLDFARRSFPLWRIRQAVDGVLQLSELDRLDADIRVGGDAGAAARSRLARLAEENPVPDGDD